MNQLTVDEVKELCSIFSNIDQHKTILLLLFQKAHSKYDIFTMMKEMPKPYRIVRATLYRKVDELYESLYLDKIKEKEREFKKGKLEATVSYYQLTLKGYIAGVICLYNLYMSSDLPADLEKQFEVQKIIEGIQKREFSSGWKFYIEFLRWHKERGIDLGKARIDMAYFIFTLTLSILEKADELAEKDFEELVSRIRQLGVPYDQNPKEILELVNNIKTAIQGLDKNFLELLFKKSKFNR